MFDKLKDKISLKSYYDEHKLEKVFKYFVSAIPAIFILPMSDVFNNPTVFNVLATTSISVLSFFTINGWYNNSVHAKLFQQEIFHHINDDVSELVKKEYYHMFQKMMLYYILATYKKNFSLPSKCEKMTTEAYEQQIIGFKMQVATEMEKNYLQLQELINNNNAIPIQLLSTCLRLHKALENGCMLDDLQKEYSHLSDKEMLVKIKENEMYYYSFEKIQAQLPTERTEAQEEKVNELFKTMKNKQYLKTSL